MNLLSRINNLWKLSNYTPYEPNEKVIFPKETVIPTIVREPAQFIPRYKKDPVKEITEEKP